VRARRGQEVSPVRRAQIGLVRVELVRETGDQIEIGGVGGGGRRIRAQPRRERPGRGHGQLVLQQPVLVEDAAQGVAPGVETDRLGERSGEERLAHATGIGVDGDGQAAQRSRGRDLGRLADESGQEARLPGEGSGAPLRGQLHGGVQALVEEPGLHEQRGGGREPGSGRLGAGRQRLVVVLARALRRQGEPQDLAGEVQLDPESGAPHFARDSMGLRPARCGLWNWVHAAFLRVGRLACS
jgi:hypothetical protein